MLSKQVVGIGFAQQLSPVGGTAPYTVTKLGGPAFLSVDNSGVVFGTLPSVGAFNLTVRVTDSTGKTADQTVPLTVQDGCDTRVRLPMPSVWPWSTSIGRPAGPAGPLRRIGSSPVPAPGTGSCATRRRFVAHIVLENEATVTGGNNLVGSI